MGVGGQGSEDDRVGVRRSTAFSTVTTVRGAHWVAEASSISALLWAHAGLGDMPVAASSSNSLGPRRCATSLVWL